MSAPEARVQEGLASVSGAPSDEQKRMMVYGLLGALVLVAVVTNVVQLPKRDLAEGQPWRASSEWPDCRPLNGRCTTVASPVFFHTLEEESPWVELDLGASRRVSRVSVVNRKDLQERAVPLVVELSDDAKTWREVARRDQSFDVWEPAFAPQEARYVRLRAERTTWLHLEKVSVYR